MTMLFKQCMGVGGLEDALELNEKRSAAHKWPLSSGIVVENSDQLVQAVDQVVREKRRFTISELPDEISVQISRASQFSAVTERLGYHKFCAL